MKITLVLMSLWVGAFCCHLYYAAEQSHAKPYTVRIINGSPQINYEATLQVDSFTIINNKCAFVYADGNFLKINADNITITKN